MTKNVLITGGSRGIGAAAATYFSKQGYRVICTYNNSADAAIALQSKLNSQGGDVHLIRCDLSDQSQIDKLFERLAIFRKLDVVVNNAGVSFSGTVQDVKEQNVEYMWQVNALAAYSVCRHAYPLFCRADSPSVVNVSSIWGVQGASCEVGYSMTKHALVGLTLSLAKEWADSGICVNCICPPIVETDMCAHLTDNDKQSFCHENNCSVYTADQVAADIFALATGGCSGTVVKEA